MWPPGHPSPKVTLAGRLAAGGGRLGDLEAEGPGGHKTLVCDAAQSSVGKNCL